MKIRIFVSALLLAFSASAQTPLPARQVSVNTNGWASVAPTATAAQASFDWIDANWDPRPDDTDWNSGMGSLMTAGPLLSQDVFDYLDGLLVGLGTNDLVMKGTNIVGASYSNNMWYGLGKMPGTSIEDYAYSAGSDSWVKTNAPRLFGTNIVGSAAILSNEWDVSAWTAHLFPSRPGYESGLEDNFDVIGATNGAYAGLVTPPLASTSTVFRTFNWIDAYFGRLETRLGRALDLDYVGLYSRSNNAVSPAPGWTAPCKDDSLTNGVWYTWNSLWPAMNTNFMSLGSAEMYTRNANVINIPSNTLYVVYAWAASTGVRANVGLYGADISGLTNVAYGEADFYSVGSEDYVGNQAVMASWVGASPANSNLVFTPVVAFFGPLGVVKTNTVYGATNNLLSSVVITTSVNKLSIRVQKIGMADATLY